jgi:hypothetical protein
MIVEAQFSAVTGLCPRPFVLARGSGTSFSAACKARRYPLFVRNAIKLVDQVVNFGVGRGDFAVDAFDLRGGELAGMLLLVQFQHPVNEFHHFVVPDEVGRGRFRAPGELSHPHAGETRLSAYRRGLLAGSRARHYPSIVSTDHFHRAEVGKDEFDDWHQRPAEGGRRRAADLEPQVRACLLSPRRGKWFFGRVSA